MFETGHIIRHKKTAKPYLIVYINEQAVFVTDLQSKEDPTPIYAVLPRDVSNYVRDLDMTCYTVKQYGYWKDVKNIFVITRKLRLR